ncbi:A disintegrin and metalloproteinase with thrombospondin motifs adt-1-like [Saccostrea cucullata]|uniref:A disintegrin and metalloproteinase with thrombospondin motifs adt-1-like n=1 Tax=Saccostrea cuccullata TaxID=36930 RepID=UPI002ED67773
MTMDLIRTLILIVPLCLLQLDMVMSQCIRCSTDQDCHSYRCHYSYQQIGCQYHTVLFDTQKCCLCSSTSGGSHCSRNSDCAHQHCSTGYTPVCSSSSHTCKCGATCSAHTDCAHFSCYSGNPICSLAQNSSRTCTCETSCTKHEECANHRCSSMYQPTCKSGQCTCVHRCTSNSYCSRYLNCGGGTSPYCSTVKKICECEDGDSHCTRDSDCAHQHCSTGYIPVCSLSSHSCRCEATCNTNTDCSHLSCHRGDPVCSSAQNNTRKCTCKTSCSSHQDCANHRCSFIYQPTCKSGQCTCVHHCISNSYCSFHLSCKGGRSPYCSTITKICQCEECLVDSDCSHHHCGTGYSSKCVHDACVCQANPVDGSWSHWASWSSCSATCGSGIHKRTRSCTNPKPQHGGRTCLGNDVQSAVLNGGWSLWSPWSTCSATCGSILQSRLRFCNNPPPSNGGNKCTGSAQEAKVCNLPHCPVNGGWSLWSPWSTCSATCGSILQSRSRFCNNPPPSNGGNKCTGSAQEAKVCNLPHCPVNGGWSLWSPWSTCSATCGSVLQSRLRFCDNPPPSNGGNMCTGSAQESEVCNLPHCPVDGRWSSWEAWTSCSATCGNGTQSRSRNCKNPPPSYGGQPCSGSSEEQEVCHSNQCPAEGLSCPTCDQNLSCAWNSTCDSTETCMIRKYIGFKLTVHCSKKDDCSFEKLALPEGEIFCCDTPECIRRYLGL